MTKINLPDIGSLANAASARQAINDNFTAIEAEFDNSLSRDGSTPNQMEADIDLNDHKLLNVADPVDEADGVNLRSIRPIVSGYISEIAETIIEGTARVEVFTATAGQTDFVLQESPGTVHNLMLIDSGIVMTPGVDYTLTGSDLKTATFFVGRDADNEIVARYTMLAPTDSILRGDLNNASAGRGGDLVAYTPPSTSVLGSVKSFLDNMDAGYRFLNQTAPARGGFFKDDHPATKLHRFRDRVFFGDGVVYTGRRTAPYGGSWMTEYGASYFEKNAQVTVLSSESGGRIGLMVGSRTEPGVASAVNMGIGALSLNQGASSTGRAGYFEAMHKSTVSGATYGLEIQGGDFGSVDYVANAYSVTGGYVGMMLSVEGAHNYTVGDANTPVSAPTKPGNAVFDITGGTQNGVSGNYRWRTGIVFRNGSLYRGTVDGLSGTAKAISMAQQHEVVWEASSTLRGATLRSDVTAVANQDVGILFKNNDVQIVGTAERAIARFGVDTVGTPVNNMRLVNARTGISPKLSAEGTDTNVGLDFQAKGTGVIKFLGQGGSAESLRLAFNAAYVNFAQVQGALAGSSPIISAQGSDANIDLTLTPKGTGVLRFGAFNALAGETLNGWIQIRDAGGTLRKVAIIA